MSYFLQRTYELVYKYAIKGKRMEKGVRSRSLEGLFTWDGSGVEGGRPCPQHLWLLCTQYERNTWTIYTRSNAAQHVSVRSTSNTEWIP